MDKKLIFFAQYPTPIPSRFPRVLCFFEAFNVYVVYFGASAVYSLEDKSEVPREKPVPVM